MNRILVLIPVVLVLLLVDYIFFKALKDSFKQLSGQRWFGPVYWAIPALLFLAALIMLGVLGGKIPFRYKQALGVIFLVIYSSKLVGSLVFLIGNAINILKNTGQKIVKPQSEGEIITRSEFISKTAAVVGLTHIGAMSWGIISGAYDYRLRRIDLQLKGLPRQFDGMTIAQISDIHTGSFYNKTAVNGGVDMLLAEKPDMVFFTGDLVNDRALELNEYFDTFKRVKAPLGVYSTLGNHDYGDYHQWKTEAAKQKNLQDLIEGHRLLGWDLLMDENRAITLNGEHLGILGVQNWGTDFIKKGDLDRTLQGTEEYSNKLLLSHDPTHWRAQILDKTDIDAVFSGHTHGMQYGVEIPGFKWSPVQYLYKEWAGLYEENGQQLYVNRGYGFIGYPGRLGILPEISLFTLKAV